MNKLFPLEGIIPRNPPLSKEVNEKIDKIFGEWVIVNLSFYFTSFISLHSIMLEAVEFAFYHQPHFLPLHFL
jgi:hypothetical protein